MITTFKIFENKELTYEDIVNKLGLDSHEDADWMIKWKQEGRKLDIVEEYLFKHIEISQSIIEYFEYKYNRNNKFKDVKQIYTSFFWREEDVPVEMIGVSTIGIVACRNNSYQYEMYTIKTMEDREEFVRFINNPEMFKQSKKYNL